ncbi:uncharacterized protein PSANT_06651 [Moesziomyces antarcticus]|uniref:Uncharacterized protein n=1 Tax=Pseudozyma antarctica TaxID=84753 RepID=A0A5C3FXM2_PSEA2|nr:uncharacterized protein PSANT_06651 [Moesziomyces antarcticus]
MTLDVEQRPWAGVRVFEAGQLGCVVGRDAVFVWLGTRAMRSIGYQPSRCPSSIGPIPEAPAAHRIRLGAQIRPTARQSCKMRSCTGTGCTAQLDHGNLIVVEREWLAA